MSSTSIVSDGMNGGPGKVGRKRKKAHDRQQRRDKKKPIPLVQPQMRSRKKARVVTSLFHKFTRERDEALGAGDDSTVKELDRKIEELGGRDAYQQASQLSTKFFSTSKWVLGFLSRNGWLYGRPEVHKEVHETETSKRKRAQKKRRMTRLLEVGAINTELLDAAREKRADGSLKHGLQVRAIDLKSSHRGIEEQDFLSMPIQKPPYDVIVCSMVVNCVTTPQARGLMLTLLYQQLRSSQSDAQDKAQADNGSGYLFLTLPKLCFLQSPHMTFEYFEALLVEGVGFEIVETKQTPKIAFYILRKPIGPLRPRQEKNQSKFSQMPTLRRGKKYRNKFAITLPMQPASK